MNWERIGKITYQLLFWLIEWGFKLCAVVALILTLASRGSFGEKLGTGFGSLSDGLRKFLTFPELFNEISWAVREYQQVGGTKFREAYGLAPIDQLIATLYELFVMFNRISHNLWQQPLSSIAAAVLVFGSFYLLARIMRFTRQKGRKSWLCRFELRMGNRVFSRDLSKIKKRQPRRNRRGSFGKAIRDLIPKLN